MTTRPTTPDRPAREGFWLRIIAIASILVVAAVAFLILGPRPDTAGKLDVSALPTVNACLNATTAVLLCVAWLLVRQKRIAAHRNVMLTAFGTSTAFLVSYVLYHFFKAAPRLYAGNFRPLYLAVLASHSLLAAIIVPLALVTLYRGWASTPARHRRIARITLPLWLYVSATGVVVYVMLYL